MADGGLLLMALLAFRSSSSPTSRNHSFDKHPFLHENPQAVPKDVLPRLK
jgi:hypothetical protein